jgi:hypothetical protein
MTGNQGHRTRSGQMDPAESEWLYANCPILSGTTRITNLAQDMRRTMRKLRRDLNRCKTCPAGQQCPFLQDYEERISEAISAVLAEFNE